MDKLRAHFSAEIPLGTRNRSVRLNGLGGRLGDEDPECHLDFDRVGRQFDGPGALEVHYFVEFAPFCAVDPPSTGGPFPIFMSCLKGQLQNRDRWLPKWRIPPPYNGLLRDTFLRADSLFWVETGCGLTILS